MQKLEGFNIDYKNYYKNYYNDIFKAFKNWLINIEEDNPLPYEINTVLFMLIKNSNIYSLSFSGHEKKVKRVNSGPFHPLEGQYFYNKNLMGIHFLSGDSIEEKRFVVLLVQDLIADFLKEKESKFLVGKRIAMGFAFDKPILVD